MIKLLFLLANVPFAAFCQADMKKRKTGELVIHGTVSNLKDSIRSVYLISLDGSRDGVDSVKVVNNKYTFRLQPEVATLVTLYSKDPGNIDNLKDGNMFTLVAEPSTVSVFSKDSFSNSTVSGSRVFPEYNKLEAQREPYTKQWATLRESYVKKEKEADSVGMEQLQERMDSTMNKLYENVYYAYLKENPSSRLRHYVLYRYLPHLKPTASDEEAEKVEKLYSRLSDKEKASYYGKRVKRKLDSYKIGVGMKAPAFTQNDTAGNPVSLASFKGKYVLLDFWASWCVPCRAENPNVVKAFNAYKDKGFTVLGISLDKPGDKDKWIKAIYKDGLTWTHVSDLLYWNNAAARLYRVSSIPQNFLLDPSGKIIGKDLRGNQLEKKLKEVLK